MTGGIELRVGIVPESEATTDLLATRGVQRIIMPTVDTQGYQISGCVPLSDAAIVLELRSAMAVEEEPHPTLVSASNSFLPPHRRLSMKA